MIRLLFTAAACASMALDHVESAVVAALLAIAWSLPGSGIVRRWLGWDEAIARARDDSTLFGGRRDDDE